MKIKYHVHHLGELQRSVVEVSPGTLFRRIHRFFNPHDGKLIPSGTGAPEWHEQIHTGDFHTVFEAERVTGLEANFITALIASQGTDRVPVRGTDESGTPYHHIVGSASGRITNPS